MRRGERERVGREKWDRHEEICQSLFSLSPSRERSEFSTLLLSCFSLSPSRDRSTTGWKRIRVVLRWRPRVLIGLRENPGHEVSLRPVFWILLFSSPKGLNISREVFSLVDTDYVYCIRVCVNREYDSIFLSEEIGLEKAR
ncbi:MAG: hypothetical protein PHD64_11635 [Mesotoga sp.]|nr:hypothetical protein [Mesotoga sp.]